MAAKEPASGGPAGRHGATYDLHLHTCWSYDGLVEAETYFRRAEELGLRCIAVTEHHVADSRAEVEQAARRHPAVQSVSGAELSVETAFGAVDLLCYGLPAPQPRQAGLPAEPGVALRGLLETYHEWQREYGAAFCRGMRALGFDFTDGHHREVIESYRPARVIRLQGYTRVRNGVLRKYFAERGFIEGEEGYAALCRRVEQAVALPPYPRAEDAAPVVRDAGALVALAHPYRYFAGEDRRRMDALREACDLDGVECAHPSVPPELAPAYRAYCVEHGLVSVAGSDCHTEEEMDRLFARHGGEEEWLDEFLAVLGGRSGGGPT